MPASSARVSAIDCPSSHDKPDRRKERICHRPVITGTRKTAVPTIHPASNKTDRENVDDCCGVADDTGAPSAAAVTDGIGAALFATRGHAARLTSAIGTATCTDGATREVTGSSNVAPNVKASRA